MSAESPWPNRALQGTRQKQRTPEGGRYTEQVGPREKRVVAALL